MNSKIALVLTVLFLFSAISFSIGTHAEPDVLDVPVDFPTIQAAINNASNGDTIFVHEGLYPENVVVNKTVSLVGENREKTIIDGNSTGTALEITIENVSVQNFTIRHGGSNDGESGIYVTACSCNVTGNIVVENGLYGICLNASSNILVSGNIVDENAADGIVLFSSINNTLSANTVAGNTFGLHLFASNQNRIINNTLERNDHGGIDLFYSSNNLLTDNNSTGNSVHGLILAYSSENNTLIENALTANLGYGLTVDYSSNNLLRSNKMDNNTYNFNCPAASPATLADFLNDIDPSNTVNGKPIYYLTNKEKLLLKPSTLTNAGYLALINCTGMTLQDMTFAENGQGLLLAFTNNTTVANIAVHDNDYGIQLLSSFDNTITHSTVVNNSNDGIVLDYGSSTNIVSNNTIANNINGIRIFHQYTDGNYVVGNVLTNNARGLWINSYVNRSVIVDNMLSNNTQAISMWRKSDESTIARNTLINNTEGLFMSFCNDNWIFNNNFLNNKVQATMVNSTNTWDNGLPDGGNFWSDYNGTDSDADGIGEAPYIVDADNPDRYPLMGAFYNFQVTTESGRSTHVQVISNSSVSNCTVLQWLSSPSALLQPGDTYISFMVEGENGSNGFCRVAIPRSVLNGSYTVLVDGQETPATELSESNENLAYLYFTYEHSVHEVIIVPEFPSAMILPLLIISVAAVAIANNRKSIGKPRERSKISSRPLFKS
jgi:parallel beta-helix repeat protein